MLDFLKAIVDAIIGFTHFVTNLVSGLINALALIPEAFVLLEYSLAFVPSVLLVFAMAGLTICVVFHIIGR